MPRSNQSEYHKNRQQQRQDLRALEQLCEELRMMDCTSYEVERALARAVERLKAALTGGLG